ncbi:MAG: type IV secretory pathway protein [Nitrosopumilaceae archaeon]|nr:type IV secretory pathway protein [Nitrosopumilaceae archaeon]NIP10604.1 type IV secretory pathway protein [Nitrosopumilaceae archaeon]NIS94927.1 type IV secretory pathway protein [Nitrosopumilaceae archaeon]
MKLNIFKDKLNLTKNKGKKDDTSLLASGTEQTLEQILNEKPGEKTEIKEKTIPQFMSLSKLEFEKYDVRSGIIKDPTAKGGIRYQILEPTLSERDKKALDIIKKLLMTELSVSMGEIKSKKEAELRLGTKIEKMIKNYRLKIPRKNIAKIKYYAVRDFIHLGKIEPLMRDHMIEEISCDGTGIPLYVWHREHESIPTNIMFEKDSELNNFARKLAYICGKHVSMADPIVDATLPDGSRINLTLGHEITKRGSTFTIRRFRADPITIVDLIKFGTVSIDIAAFMWYLAEKKSTMLVAGGTASGKTTALNALSTFIKPGQKVVSIEDTQELNLPHENWVPAVSRQTFTDTQIGEINQFDLLRAALRQRPDIIIVGETRGKEAYTLFQAMATGHGGFSSIHADSIDATLTRLTSAPMEVPKALIANSLDLITLQLKIRVGNKSARRIIQVAEIDGIDEKTGQIKTNTVFRWNPTTDQHEFSGRSVVFEKIKERDGETDEKINYELTKRRVALEWLVKNNIREHKKVSENIMEYYENPERFYERKRINV